MEERDTFFVGWKGNISDESRKLLKRLLWPVMIGIPVIIFLIVYFTKPFGPGVFQLGNVQEFTGTFFDDPFPTLLLDPNQDIEVTHPIALLVGYGKSGADSYLNAANMKFGDISGKKIRLQGTLITGKDRTVIELTKKNESVIEVLDSEVKYFEKTEETPIVLNGEIIDPKCYFGVMKPGEGKVHKSCAIRCLSGGIPAVLKSEHNGRRDYYILMGTQEESINKDILEFVGEPISVSGYTFETNGWKALKVNPEDIIYQ